MNCPGLPVGAAAALAALHFTEPRPEALARLNDRERIGALDFCHHAGLALLVREVLPAATARDAANNLLRLRALEETYRQLAGLPVEFVALKGITQCEFFGIRPEDRAQSDIDLYCPRETVETARDALIAAGYRPIAGLEAFPTDHLPALMRPTDLEVARRFLRSRNAACRRTALSVLESTAGAFARGGGRRVLDAARAAA